MKSKQGNISPALYTVARITSCFGIKGFVKVLSLTHSPERLGKLTTVLLGKSDRETVPYTIDEILFQARAIVMKFQSVDDRTQAEKLVGNYLFVTENELVPPPKGSWFIHDIIGCKVFHENGALLGVVNDVWPMAGTDLWDVSNHGTSVMFPADKRLIVKVDIRKKTIIVNPPDGLFEEEDRS